MEFLIKISALILIIIGAQWLVRVFIMFLNEKINSTEKHIRGLLKEGEIIESSKYNFENFYKESTDLFLISKRREIINYVTIIIGVIEILLFGGLTFILIQENYSFFDIFSKLSNFAAVWIALKIFGNYHQWAGSIFGRIHFYIFFIGSILNILFAILIGQIATEFFL